MSHDNLGKISLLCDDVYYEGFDYRTDVPYIWQQGDPQLKSEYCTDGVTDENWEKFQNLIPMLDNFMDLRLGWKNDLAIFSMFLLFKEEGLCAFYNDNQLGKERLSALNQLDKAKFDHQIFGLDS